MNAPEPQLAERILALIARATSKRPAHAADVRALVGGEDAAFWAALEQLTRERRINSAHLQRPATDPAPWLAIWPTGVCLAPAPLSGASFGGLFVPQRPGAMRDAHAPRSAPPRSTQLPSTQPPSEGVAPVNASTPASPAAPDAGKTRSRASAELRRAQIAQMLSGRTAAQGLPLAEVAARLGLTVPGANYLLDALVDVGLCGKVRLPGERHCRVFDPQASAASAAGTASADAAPADADVSSADVTSADVTSAEAPVDLGPLGDEIAAWGAALEPEAEPTPPALAPAAAAAAIEFALWDDGRLSIYDGDTLTQLAAPDTARLARLLGVPADICFPLQGA